MQKFLEWLQNLFTQLTLLNKSVQLQGRETPEIGEQRAVKLGIIVGHDKKNPGAKLYGTDQYEYDWNSDLAKRIQEEAKRLGTIVVEIIMRDSIGIEGAYKKAEKLKCDAVIELHFNAANGRAQGTETLSSADLTDVEFATVIQNAQCRVFGREGQSRGVKVIARTARGGINVHAFPGGRNCLIEPFFGDNAQDAAIAIARKQDLAIGLLAAVEFWARKKDMI